MSTREKATVVQPKKKKKPASCDVTIAGVRRHALPRVKDDHPQGLGGAQLPGRPRLAGEGGRLRPEQVSRGGFGGVCCGWLWN